MGKIADLIHTALDSDENVEEAKDSMGRPISISMQKAMKSSDDFQKKEGRGLEQRLNDMVQKLKKVKKECQGLDKKSERHLEDTILKLSNMAVRVKRDGIKGIVQ